jgi:uncharacterized membrane protein YeaQ/YmgE (transglycosylase-associated protein family)
MSFISWIVVGLIIGALAQWSMLRNPPGMTVTIPVSIAGALAGGCFGAALPLPPGPLGGFVIPNMVFPACISLVVLTVERHIRS